MSGDLARESGAWGGDGSVGVVSGRGWRAWEERASIVYIKGGSALLTTWLGDAGLNAVSCLPHVTEGRMRATWWWGGMKRELQRVGEDGGACRGPVQCNATQLEMERTPRAQPSACCHGNQIPPPSCIPTDWLPLSLPLSLSLFCCLCCIFPPLSYVRHNTGGKCMRCIKQRVYSILEMHKCKMMR